MPTLLMKKKPAPRVPALSRRGRPFSPKTEAALLAEVPGILAKKGYAGLTMDEAAKKAGVGKAAIYRRWEGKEELIVQSLRLAFAKTNPEIPRMGSPEENLIQLLQNIARMLRGPVGRCMRRLVSEIPDHPVLADLIHELDRERRTFILQALTEAGLAADSEAVSMFLGPLYFRLLITEEEISPAFVRSYVLRLLNSQERG